MLERVALLSLPQSWRPLNSTAAAFLNPSFLTFLCPAEMVPKEESFDDYVMKKVMGNRMAFTDPSCKVWVSLSSSPHPRPQALFPKRHLRGPPLGVTLGGLSASRMLGN